MMFNAFISCAQLKKFAPFFNLIPRSSAQTSSTQSSDRKFLRSSVMKSSKDKVSKVGRSEEIQSLMCTSLNAPSMYLTWFLSSIDFAIKNSLNAFSRINMVCGEINPAVRIGQCFVTICSTEAFTDVDDIFD